jgi:serine/threonine protein kinase
MLHGLKKLHGMGIAHRNIRVESIATRLDDEEGMVTKLTRFNLASQTDRSSILVIFCPPSSWFLAPFSPPSSLLPLIFFFFPVLTIHREWQGTEPRRWSFNKRTRNSWTCGP